MACMDYMDPDVPCSKKGQLNLITHSLTELIHAAEWNFSLKLNMYVQYHGLNKPISFYTS